MELVPGTYDVTATKTYYTSQTVNGVVVVANQATAQDFTLTFLGSWTQIALPADCPDWFRMDAEYYAPTGKAYLLGGRSGMTTDGTIYSFDPVAQTCADTGQTMPVPISNYTIVPVNNGTADLLCTFGGRDSGGGSTKAVQCYDPVANTVSQVSTLPGSMGRFFASGAAAVNNIAYVFGGFRNTKAPYHIAETWAWDPVANTWSRKGSQSIGRGHEQVAVVDGKIYAFGGDVYDGRSLSAQTVAEVFDPATGHWSLIAPLAAVSGEGRGFGFDTASGYALAGQIVLAGGGQWAGDTNAVLTYNTATDTYGDYADLSVERRDHAGFFVPGNPGVMWVFGGLSWAAGYGGDNPPYAPPEYNQVPWSAPQHPAHINQDKMSWAVAARPGTYKVVFSARIHDELHAPLAGATVLGTWTYPDGSTHDKSCVTDTLGRCKSPIKEPQTGVYQFCVTDVQKVGYQYAPAANEAPACRSVTVVP